jgi:hypothetical protein
MYNLDTQTVFGKISMIRLIDGERYYFCVDEDGDVSMIPESTLEEMEKENE